MSYRPLLIAVLGLSLTGCVAYGYDDNRQSYPRYNGGWGYIDHRQNVNRYETRYYGYPDRAYRYEPRHYPRYEPRHVYRHDRHDQHDWRNERRHDWRRDNHRGWEQGSRDDNRYQGAPLRQRDGHRGQRRHDGDRHN